MTTPDPDYLTSVRLARAAYRRIMHAAKHRRGVRLSAEEVVAMSLDGCIATAADPDGEPVEGE